MYIKLCLQLHMHIYSSTYCSYLNIYIPQLLNDPFSSPAHELAATSVQVLLLQLAENAAATSV